MHRFRWVYCKALVCRSFQRYYLDKMDYMLAVIEICQYLEISMTKLYAVQSILDKKNIGGRVHYLIKWKDFDEDEATWEMYAHLKHLKPLIMEYNARQRIKNWQQEVVRKEERHASKLISMKNEREKREKEFIKAHRMKADLNWKAQRNRIDVSTNQNMSILSILEDQLAGEEGNRQDASQHQGQEESKQEEKVQESGELSLDADDCLTQVSQEEESAASECPKKKAVTQKMTKPFSMNLPNDRLAISKTEKSLRELSSYSSEIDDSQSEYEQTPKSKARKNSNGRKGVRMSVVKRKDKKGLEYFVEDKSAMIKRYSGKEVIQYYPADFLAFAEAIIRKYMP